MRKSHTVLARDAPSETWGSVGAPRVATASRPHLRSNHYEYRISLTD